MDLSSPKYLSIYHFRSSLDFSLLSFHEPSSFPPPRSMKFARAQARTEPVLRTYVLISRWHRRNSVYTDTGHFLASPRRSWRNEREREAQPEIDTRVFSKRAFPRNGGFLSIDRTTDGFDRSCSIFSREDVFERNFQMIDFVCQIFFFFFFGTKETSSIYYLGIEYCYSRNFGNRRGIKYFS